MKRFPNSYLSILAAVSIGFAATLQAADEKIANRRHANSGAAAVMRSSRR